MSEEITLTPEQEAEVKKLMKKTQQVLLAEAQKLGGFTEAEQAAVATKKELASFIVLVSSADQGSGDVAKEPESEADEAEDEGDKASGDEPREVKPNLKSEPSPGMTKPDESGSGDVAKEMAKYPKVRMIIPLGKGEKKGLAYETVNLNGLRYEIKKGMYVDLPQPIAELLANYLEQQLGNGNLATEQAYRMDRETPGQEGIKASSALN